MMNLKKMKEFSGEMKKKIVDVFTNDMYIWLGDNKVITKTKAGVCIMELATANVEAMIPNGEFARYN